MFTKSCENEPVGTKSYDITNYLVLLDSTFRQHIDVPVECLTYKTLIGMYLLMDPRYLANS